MAAIYILISFLWLLTIFMSFSLLIKDLDMIVRIFFLLFFIIILDWALSTFNYGYGIIGGVVGLAAIYYVLFPLDFISGFTMPPEYVLIVLMFGIPFLMLYHHALLERRAGIEGRWAKYSSIVMAPSVSVLTLLALLLFQGKLSFLVSDPIRVSLPLLILSIFVIFLPFPRVAFSIHHSLKVQTKLEGKEISKWSILTSLAYFAITSFFALVFSPSCLGFSALTSSKYLVLTLMALSFLSIASIFTFSYEGLEFLAQRIPEGKGSPEVARTIYLAYYFAVPIILITLSFHKFYSLLDSIYIIIGPALATFFIFAASVRRRRIEG